VPVNNWNFYQFAAAEPRCKFAILPQTELDAEQNTQGENTNMRFGMILAVIWLMLLAATAFGQNFEITAFGGGQINGGMDLSTSVFHRIEVRNGTNYGLGAGYLLGDHFSAEFTWTYNKADTVAQPQGGVSSVKLFNLDTNQYFGNFLFHFANRETPLRPFLLLGAGATNLHPAVTGLKGATRFAFAVAGGAKYNFSRRLGLRLQAKWSPTYLTTTSDGIWCDPFWGGCWVVGNSHFLHEFDATAGLTLRF